MARHRFRVMGLFDMASRPTVATVTIDREAGLFEVRPLRRRKLYCLPLADVASMVTRKLIHFEERERRRAKKAKRRGAGR